MKTIVSLYSNKNKEIEKFLQQFYDNQIEINDTLEWEKEYDNPIEITDIIGVFVDNKEKYDINMWISIDPKIFINITDHNADQIIRYLFERYPY